MTTQTDILTIQLNTLLEAVDLPFVLQSPTDLTPSLLLAILESILHVHIPFERGEHIQTIKVFLGILETDVLKTDVGLSQIDPRLLAIGARDEVIYVAEVLCWIGQELGLVSSTPTIPNALDSDEGVSSIIPSISSLDPAPPYDQTQLTSPSSTITFLPPFTDSSPPTTSTLLFSTEPNDTFQTNTTSLPTTSSRHTVSPLQFTAISTIPPPPSTPSPPPPQTIPPDDSSFTRLTPPIRRSGCISLVDHELELSAFYSHSRSLETPRSSSQRQPMFSTSLSSSYWKSIPRSATSRQCSDDGDTPEPDWRGLLSQSHDYDPRRTHELLQLRTQLMEELVRIRMNRRSR